MTVAFLLSFEKKNYGVIFLQKLPKFNIQRIFIYAKKSFTIRSSKVQKLNLRVYKAFECVLPKILLDFKVNLEHTLAKNGST